MTNWFTSDLHFGHVNILKYCPQRFAYLGIAAPAELIARCFAEQAALAGGYEPQDPVGSTELTPYIPAMNEALVEIWNAQVHPYDHVLVGGDVAMGKVDQTIEYVKRLNGRKELVLGNHDKPHPICSKGDEKQRRWAQVYAEAGFTAQTFSTILSFDGIVANVCHFPYFGDHSEDRYNKDLIGQYVPEDDGRPLVHGHVHDLWKTNGQMFNLGIDAWDGEFLEAEAIGAYFRSIGYTA